MSNLRGVLLDQVSFFCYWGSPTEAGRGTPVILLPTTKLGENYIFRGWWKGMVIVQVHFQTMPLPLGRASLAIFQIFLLFSLKLLTVFR